MGISPDYSQFDMDITIHINSVLAILAQLGVGPPNGSSIKDGNETWEMFLGDAENLEFVKSYIYLKVGYCLIRLLRLLSSIVRIK